MENNPIYKGKVTLALDKNSIPIIITESFTEDTSYINYICGMNKEELPSVIALNIYTKISMGYDLDIVDGDACRIPHKTHPNTYMPLLSTADKEHLYPLNKELRNEILAALNALDISE